MGSETGALVPIPNARVEIYDEEIFNYPTVGWQHLPWPDAYLGAVYTDSNGYFSFSVNNDDGWTIIGDENGRDIYLKIMASNGAAAVKDEVGWLGGKIYSFKTNTNKDMGDGTTWDIGSLAPDNADCEVAFEVMHIVDLAWRHVKEETGIELRKVNVFIDDYFAIERLASFYLPELIADYLNIYRRLPPGVEDYYPTELIEFLEGLLPEDLSESLSLIKRGMINDVAGIHLYAIQKRSTEDFYEVIFHEYGHHIMSKIFELGPPFSIYGNHSFEDEFNPEHAWVEGWAEYYSCIASERYGIDYTLSLGDIESAHLIFDYGSDDDSDAAWDSVEGNIACLLWDLTDPANEAHDAIDLTFGELVSLIENFDPDPGLLDVWPMGKDHVWNIHDLFNAFRSRYDPQTASKFWVLLDEHGISEPDNTPPNNPTSYTFTFSSTFGSPYTDIQVDLLGGNDDTSGIKEYVYEWFYASNQEMLEQLANLDWSEELQPIAYHWEFSTSPHIELEGAGPGDWYLVVTVFDHVGNWAGDVLMAGPFKVSANPVLLFGGPTVNSPSSTFVTSITTLQIDTPTYPGKDFTGNIRLRLPDFGGNELDYTAPLSFGSIFGIESEDGDYNLEIKFLERYGNDETQVVQFRLDDTPPTLELDTSQPRYSTSPVYISRNSELTITANDVGVGLERIEYRIFNSQYDSGWKQYLTPVRFTNLPDGEYIIEATAEDRLNNQASEQIAVYIDNTPPQTEILIGAPQNSESPTAVSRATPFSIEGADAGAGLANKKFRISTMESEGAWTDYTAPFTLNGFPDGNYIISQLTQDQLGNTQESSISVFLDNAAPSITNLSIAENSALQGNIHLHLQADDPTGVASVKFAIVQTDSSGGFTLPISMTPAAYNPSTQRWILEIDTLKFKDGFYKVIIETQDSLGNGGIEDFDYIIRNWAVLDLSHFTETAKAGRRMPIKFNLHINGIVDEKTTTRIQRGTRDPYLQDK
ncbi:MAG: Ig-like domain-containing protein [Methanomassiliicoccales archaeon]|jgi:hypothetical protein|nr:Ig-like domain-containing protein [Methanomassiliicoccales archaeon]